MEEIEGRTNRIFAQNEKPLYRFDSKIVLPDALPHGLIIIFLLVQPPIKMDRRKSRRETLTSQSAFEPLITSVLFSCYLFTSISFQPNCCVSTQFGSQRVVKPGIVFDFFRCSEFCSHRVQYQNSTITIKQILQAGHYPNVKTNPIMTTTFSSRTTAHHYTAQHPILRKALPLLVNAYYSILCFISDQAAYL